jgi:RNA polymerase sigma-70 factor, ECF subfamily
VLARHHQEAEDLVQETLLKAFRSIDSFRRGTSPKAWLMTILRNAHVDRVRQRAGKNALSLDSLEVDLAAEDEEAPSQDVELDALIERLGDEQLIAALRDLPPEISWTVLLVDVEGMTYPEAAEVLEVPVGTAKSRVFRGRAMLREAISLNASGAFKRLEGR